MLGSMENQIQLEHEQETWLYAASDVETKVVRGARLSWHRGRDLAEQFLKELKKHRVPDAEFLVDGTDYLTALARTDLSGDLNDTDRNVVEKLFQPYRCESSGSTKPGTVVSQCWALA